MQSVSLATRKHMILPVLAAESASHVHLSPSYDTMTLLHTVVGLLINHSKIILISKKSVFSPGHCNCIINFILRHIYVCVGGTCELTHVSCKHGLSSKAFLHCTLNSLTRLQTSSLCINLQCSRRI